MWSSDEFKSYLLVHSTHRQHTHAGPSLSPCGVCQDAFGRDVWGESVQPAIRRIVRASLQCVQQAIENRRNSHEIFGYDFMVSGGRVAQAHSSHSLHRQERPTVVFVALCVLLLQVDEGFNVWLLEVNSCPDLDYTTVRKRERERQLCLCLCVCLHCCLLPPPAVLCVQPTTEYLVRKCLHDLIKVLQLAVDGWDPHPHDVPFPCVCGWCHLTQVVVDWADAPPHQVRNKSPSIHPSVHPPIAICLCAASCCSVVKSTPAILSCCTRGRGSSGPAPTSPRHTSVCQHTNTQERHGQHSHTQTPTHTRTVHTRGEGVRDGRH